MGGLVSAARGICTNTLAAKQYSLYRLLLVCHLHWNGADTKWHVCLFEFLRRDRFKLDDDRSMQFILLLSSYLIVRFSLDHSRKILFSSCCFPHKQDKHPQIIEEKQHKTINLKHKKIVAIYLLAICCWDRHHWLVALLYYCIIVVVFRFWGGFRVFSGVCFFAPKGAPQRKTVNHAFTAPTNTPRARRINLACCDCFLSDCIGAACAGQLPKTAFLGHNEYFTYDTPHHTLPAIIIVPNQKT